MPHSQAILEAEASAPRPGAAQAGQYLLSATSGKRRQIWVEVDKVKLSCPEPPEGVDRAGLRHVWARLYTKARGGDLAAVKLLMELFARYEPARKADDTYPDRYRRIPAKAARLLYRLDLDLDYLLRRRAAGLPMSATETALVRILGDAGAQPLKSAAEARQLGVAEQYARRVLSLLGERPVVWRLAMDWATAQQAVEAAASEQGCVEVETGEEQGDDEDEDQDQADDADLPPVDVGEGDEGEDLGLRDPGAALLQPCCKPKASLSPGRDGAAQTVQTPQSPKREVDRKGGGVAYSESLPPPPPSPRKPCKRRRRKGIYKARSKRPKIFIELGDDPGKAIAEAKERRAAKEGKKKDQPSSETDWEKIQREFELATSRVGKEVSEEEEVEHGWDRTLPRGKEVRLLAEECGLGVDELMGESDKEIDNDENQGIT